MIGVSWRTRLRPSGAASVSELSLGDRVLQVEESRRLAGEPGVRRVASWWIAMGIGAAALTAPGSAAQDVEAVDFNRDVRPLLADRCFACHGRDEGSRRAGLRLDTREDAIAERRGRAALVPGDPSRSVLLDRVRSDDPGQVMPPPEAHKPAFDVAEVALLERWIMQGAPYARHWAFVPPERPTPPRDGHPVDAFVQEALTHEGLEPAAPAAWHTQLRRASFGLTGLPPTVEQLDRLGTTPSDEVWTGWIDELVASPHFGERMAMWWLDGARYADTDGYQQDATRTSWPWRDWVIDAFQSNMPFDKFTREQFAGDLFPDTTPNQRLATSFHRSHMANGEGGRDPEESRVDYVLDRVNTMGTVWLGLTLGCTQCHDHKFDPLTQADYYSLSAFFNSIDESGAAGSAQKPLITVRSDAAKHTVTEAQRVLEEAERSLATVREAARAPYTDWLSERLAQSSTFRPWTLVTAASTATVEGTPLTTLDDGSIEASRIDAVQDDYLVTMAPLELDRITAIELTVLRDQRGALSFADDDAFILTNVKFRVRTQGVSQLTPIPVHSVVASVSGDGKGENYGPAKGTLDDDPRTGWTTRAQPIGPEGHRAIFALAEPLILADDESLEVALMHRSLTPGARLTRFRLAATDQAGRASRELKPMPLEELAAWAAAAPDCETQDVPEALDQRLFEQYLADHDDAVEALARRDRALAQVQRAERAAGDLQVMVLGERETPRKTFVLERGVWDQHGEEVAPAVPAAVLEGSAATRLDLAEWIVDRANPLTARVLVNQLWQLLFGAGLVRTPDDFGLQGELPTHPQLLDWLAVELMESGWDIQRLLRTIVTSATYRQDSRTSAELLERDPTNRLLARGARFRLPSWMLRDAALQASGLLNDVVGGPPVFPYQPEGVWAEQFMGRFSYEPTLGPGQYRRTVYAFWRRTSAPTFLFDTAMRRTCEVTARRTNTPLQALTLLNDQTYVDAAGALAHALADVPLEQAIQSLYRRILSRRATPNEVATLEEVHGRVSDHYESHPSEANQLARSMCGQSLTSLDSSPALAARFVLANLVLNLDEALTHE